MSMEETKEAEGMESADAWAERVSVELIARVDRGDFLPRSFVSALRPEFEARDAQHILRAKRLEAQLAALDAEVARENGSLGPEKVVELMRQVWAADGGSDGDMICAGFQHGSRVAARRLMLAHLDARRLREALKIARAHFNEVEERHGCAPTECTNAAQFVIDDALAAHPAPDALDKGLDMAIKALKDCTCQVHSEDALIQLGIK